MTTAPLPAGPPPRLAGSVSQEPAGFALGLLKKGAKGPSAKSDRLIAHCSRRTGIVILGGTRLSFIRLFIHSINSLFIYWMPDAVVGAENKTD